MSPVKIASAQYGIGQFKEWQQYIDKVTQWVNEAVTEGSNILLLPEYASMELVSLFAKEIIRSLNKQLSAMQELHQAFVDLYQQLASMHQVYILPGTFPVGIKKSSYRNRAYLFGPEGLIGYQDKLLMTRFENEQWLINGGDSIRVFDTRFGKVGINICYDSEFPMIARKQVEMGADLLLVPSCTDTVTGYYRVRIGCQARALENQCYVLQSPTVGKAEWSEAVDINVGAAAVYTPVDYGFPDNGILAMGEFNQPQWLYAELDLARITDIRNTGQVFNYRDWPRQFEV